MKFLMLVYPGMTPLDLLGPLQVWSAWPDAEIQIVWKNTEPVMTDTGMALLPSVDFAASFNAPDVVFVPGGTKATLALCHDEEVLTFLRDRAQHSRWVCSVCTGALVLGAAGLLNGYRATTHWAAHGMLDTFGATAVEARYVIDRGRATGGGVTAGIDFGLVMLAEFAGEEVAQQVQLALEYAPEPPFNAGTPAQAPQTIVEEVQRQFAQAIV